MTNNALLFLIDSVLGKGKSTSKGNRAYHCPECKHHKLKLEINCLCSAKIFAIKLFFSGTALSAAAVGVDAL